MIDTTSPLVHGLLLDGKGGAGECELSALDRIDAATPSWLHFDFTVPEAQDWIRKRSGASPVVADALLDEDSRPRAVELDDGLLIMLRGVNHNPGQRIDDMVSIRLWLSGNQLISTRRRQLLSVRSLVEDLRAGRGPKTQTQVVVTLVQRLVERIDDVVDTINDDVEQTEMRYAGAAVTGYRGEFAALRRQAMHIRRWLAPQRTALEELARSGTVLLNDAQKLRIREEVDQLTRFLEELDLVRERAMVAQEELIAQLAQEQNSRMYILSLVAAVFLPLSFVTGLMGMNVAGLPGTEDERAFLIVCALMLIAGGAIVLLFKWRKWL